MHHKAAVARFSLLFALVAALSSCGAATRPTVPTLPTGTPIVTDLATGRAADGTWEMQGDSLVGHGPGHYVFDVEFGDALIDMEIEYVSGPKSAVGVGARSANVDGPWTRAAQGYWFNFTFNRKFNVFACQAENACRQTTPPPSGFKPTHAVRGSAERIHIELREEHYAFFINGKLVHEGEDDSFEAGKLVLGVTRGMVVRIRNLKVSRWPEAAADSGR